MAAPAAATTGSKLVRGVVKRPFLICWGDFGTRITNINRKSSHPIWMSHIDTLDNITMRRKKAAAEMKAIKKDAKRLIGKLHKRFLHKIYILTQLATRHSSAVSLCAQPEWQRRRTAPSLCSRTLRALPHAGDGVTWP